MEKYDYTKLKELRGGKGITQIEMSNRLGMTQSNYSKLEKGIKKMDSLQTLERLAKALSMPRGRLIAILKDQENIQSAGIKETELLQVQEILKKNPLREDEFVLFSSEVLELEKHGFKDQYAGINMKEYDDDLHRIDNGEALPIWEYPPVMNIIHADSVEIGFDYDKKKLKGLSIWLADKKLGIIKEEYVMLADQLINSLLISRVVLIENEDGIAGYFDTYMKAVFIATNAVCKSSHFEKGRFSSLKFLSHEEIKKIDNNEDEE